MKPTMNKSEKTGFRISLILCSCFLAIGGLNVIYVPTSIESTSSPTLFKVAHIGFIFFLSYSLMVGKQWAKIILNLFFVLGFIGSIRIMFYYFEVYSENLLFHVAFQIIFILIVLYINLSQSFKDYIQYIRTYREQILP